MVPLNQPLQAVSITSTDMQAPTADPSNDAVKAFNGNGDVEAPISKQDASIVIPPQALSGPSGVGDKDDINKEEEPAPVQYLDVTYWDITREFSILGWIAFGGPAAHIGLFQRRLVEKMRWMSDHLFLELFALAGCLPGPTSTQVSFSLGAVKKGVLGGLLGGALFQYPGALIMTGFGIAAAKVLASPPPWLSGCASGVSAVGVALVAVATKGLLIKACYDAKDPKYSNLLATICVLAAGACIYWRTFPWLFPLIIAIGALATLVWNWKKDMSVKGEGDDKIAKLGINMWGGGLLILVWLAILIPTLVLVRVLPYDHRADATPLDWFEVFYRTGTIIYGGGQVVLPMLYDDLVKETCDYSVKPPVCIDNPTTSWMTGLQFYTGLGVVQAMPGPLFNFAAYLGAIIAWNADYNPLVGVVLCWIGLFAPGILLMFALLPFWTKVSFPIRICIKHSLI